MMALWYSYLTRKREPGKRETDMKSTQVATAESAVRNLALEVAIRQYGRPVKAEALFSQRRYRGLRQLCSRAVSDALKLEGVPAHAHRGVTVRYDGRSGGLQQFTIGEAGEIS
jgi:hypothetical protein